MWAQQQQRQLSGMASVWQIPAWAPLLVPVLHCHTHLADAPPAGGGAIRQPRGSDPAKMWRYLKSLSAPLSWTQTRSNRRKVVIPKWLLADPFPEKTWSSLQDLVCQSPAHFLSRCIGCIDCCFFLSCNFTFAGRWFGFLKCIQGRQAANEQMKC